jgi:ATP-dependent RNA helicase DeaD
VTFPTTRPPLARALAERNYNDPTPVQMAVLADDAAPRDLLVSAQTGSGKTVAYGLAMANTLLSDADRLPKAAEPLALIVAPTRELALQVHRELSWLYQHAGARVVSCVGGMDPRREQRELAEGAHIVVGTPGRLCDHLRRGRLDVSALQAVVLDEADEMLDMGFREDMEFILKTTPETRRTLLFSATLPRGIIALAKNYQNNAFRVEVTDGEGGHADIDYRAIRIAAQDVEHAVVNVLRYVESPSAIVFCNTRSAVNHLQTALLERGFSVVALSGELTQNERTQALQSLRDGRARVCVATDVAARGIDLPTLGLVIHADLPNDPEVLQHRSGRTGRAGKKGISVLLVPPARRRRAELLLNMAGIDAEWSAPPTVEEIRRLDQQRMMQDTLFTEPSTEDDLVLARLLIAERSPEDIASALARLYRARLPSPEDVSDPGHGGKSRDDRGPRKEGRGERDERGPKEKPARAGAMEDGIWFRAAIGRQKNAEARWLLPMICRRGGIGKQDVGAIRIFDAHTEFQISAQALERFTDKVKRPDKEDNIRIEPLRGAPQDADRTERKHLRARKFDKDKKAPFERNDDAPAARRDKPKYSPLDPPHQRPEYPGKADHAGKEKFDKPKFGKPEFGKSKFGKAKFDKPTFEKPKFGGSESGKSKFGKSESARSESGKSKFDKPKFDKPKFDKPFGGKKPKRKKPHG